MEKNFDGSLALVVLIMTFAEFVKNLESIDVKLYDYQEKFLEQLISDALVVARQNGRSHEDAISAISYALLLDKLKEKNVNEPTTN